MLSFTLDANCIIDLKEARPNAVHITRLVQAHREGKANVAIAASIASERRQDGGYNWNFSEFEAVLKALGLETLPLAIPPMALDVNYLDYSMLISDEGEDLLRRIHGIIHPNGSLELALFLNSAGENRTVEKWQNQMLDTQAIWSHLMEKRDVFVSSDRKAFHTEQKKKALLALGVGRIEYPKHAAALV